MSTKLLIMLALCMVTPSSADLAGFVHEKMRDFLKYVEQNQLDPTPPDERNLVFFGSNLAIGMETEFRDFVISGYSKGIQVYGTEDSLDDGKNFLYPLTDVLFTATGTHATNWTVNGMQINSQGHWFSQHPSLEFGCGIQFSVLPSGYLNVTQVETTWPSWTLHNVTFDDISDNEAAEGYAAFIELMLRNAISGYEFRAGETIANIIGNFWTELLSNTTFEELVGHTGTWNPCSTIHIHYQYILILLRKRY